MTVACVNPRDISVNIIKTSIFIYRKVIFLLQGKQINLSQFLRQMIARIVFWSKNGCGTFNKKLPDDDDDDEEEEEEEKKI